MGPVPVLALLAGTFCPEIPVAVIPAVAGTKELTLIDLHRVGEDAVRERACFSTMPFEASAALENVIERCGSEEACIDEGLTAAGARAGLLIVVVKTNERWLLSVRWQEIGRRHHVRIETLDETDLEVSLPILVRRLLDDVGLEMGARLSVKVAPRGASIDLSRDGAVNPLVSGTVVPSGRYQLRIAAEGHLTEQRTLDLAPGQALDLSIELEEENALYEEWWFWTGVGVAVVGGALAIGFAASRRPTCLCTAGTFERCEILCDDL